MFGHPNCDVDYDTLYQMYIVEELSCREIGEELGWNWGTILSHLHKNKIPVRSGGLNTKRLRNWFSKEQAGANNSHQKMSNEHKEALRKFWTGKSCPNKSLPGDKNPGWKGGKRLNDYVYVRVNGKRVAEHRLIAERVLGRKLKPTEEVHHFNGKRNDNRNINLLVSNKSYHRWLESRMATLYKLEHFS